MTMLSPTRTDSLPVDRDGLEALLAALRSARAEIGQTVLGQE
ncbi:MAG: hypothetical protein K0R85_2535, partial [Devosia sp.]|nr:hypothetical protein [Devosia sp.]